MVKGKLFGIRLPHALLPRVMAFEQAVDDRFHFDVSLRAPLAGLLAHYRGWLTPDEMETAAVLPPELPARILANAAASDRG